MTKSTITYWNPIEGMEEFAEQLTLSTDTTTSEYTRLTRFHAGVDTTPFGSKSHDYPV